MATRLDDAKIKVTLDTTEARRQLGEVSAESEKLRKDRAAQLTRTERDERQKLTGKKKGKKESGPQAKKRLRKIVGTGVATVGIAAIFSDPLFSQFLASAVKDIPGLSIFVRGTMQPFLDKVNAKINELSASVTAALKTKEEVTNMVAALAVSGTGVKGLDVSTILGATFDVHKARSLLVKSRNDLQKRLTADVLGDAVADLFGNLGN